MYMRGKASSLSQSSPPQRASSLGKPCYPQKAGGENPSLSFSCPMSLVPLLSLSQKKLENVSALSLVVPKSAFGGKHRGGAGHTFSPTLWAPFPNHQLHDLLEKDDRVLGTWDYGACPTPDVSGPLDSCLRLLF